MSNANMPAMPYIDNNQYGSVYIGLTKREKFCLEMGVPETGDPELDDIIRKGERKRIAAMVIEGALSAGYHIKASKADIVDKAITCANILLEELEK